MVLKLAFRNVLRQRRRTVLTVLTMFGGFTLSSVGIGWADGSYRDVIQLFTESHTGQVQIHAPGYLDDPSLYATVDDTAAVAEALRGTDGVRGWAPRIYASGLLSAGAASAGASIRGVSPAAETEYLSLDGQLIEGSMLESDGQMLLGSVLARRLDASLGDSVVVLSGAADGSIANDRYVVAGLVESGDPTADRSACYLTLSGAGRLFRLEGRVHEIAVVCTSLDMTRPVTRSLSRRLPELDVQAWQEFAEEFYRAMKADMQGLWISIVIVVLVASASVLNTVLMSVLQRRREYGVLRALGTPPVTIVSMIVLEALIQAAVAIAAGLLVSTVALEVLSSHGISFSEPISYGGVQFQQMRAQITPRSLWLPAVVVAATALLVSIPPALKAAGISPARAMRNA